MRRGEEWKRKARRTWEERKGKERNGKEKKGTERKVKERTGREGKRREREGKGKKEGRNDVDDAAADDDDDDDDDDDMNFAHEKTTPAAAQSILCAKTCILLRKTHHTNLKRTFAPVCYRQVRKSLKIRRVCFSSAKCVFSHKNGVGWRWAAEGAVFRERNACFSTQR